MYNIAYIFYTQFDGTDKKNEIFYPEVGAYFIVVKWATNEQTVWAKQNMTAGDFCAVDTLVCCVRLEIPSFRYTLLIPY